MDSFTLENMATLNLDFVQLNGQPAKLTIRFPLYEVTDELGDVIAKAKEAGESMGQLWSRYRAFFREKFPELPVEGMTGRGLESLAAKLFSMVVEAKKADRESVAQG